MESDLSSVLKNAEMLELGEKHMRILLYNLLCSLNFLHTANVMHRDIKPDNILIDDDCGV